jgi:CRP-like cAMP-binding protein
VATESNVFRQFFGVVVAVCLVYTGTVFPFRLCFLEFRIPDGVPENTFLTAIEDLIDLTFWIDLVANFLFSFTDSQGNEITSLPAIARHYLGGFFIVNFIACVPQEFIAIFTSSEEGDSFNKGLRLGRMQRMTRLIALARLLRLVKFVNFFMESSICQKIQQTRSLLLVNFIAGLFWILHLMACGWYLIASLDVDPNKTWVARRPFDGDSTLLDGTPFEQWLHAMYFVLTVFTTVGFGDIHAVTTREILYVCFTMIVGAVVHSIIVGEMINVVMRRDQETIDRDHQRGLIDGFARHTELDAGTARKFSRWATSKAVTQGYDREHMRTLITSNVIPFEILQLLPKTMFGGELIANNFVTSYINFTRRMPKRFPALLALMLNRRCYDRGDMVYHVREHAWSLFLVSSGTFANIGKPSMSGGSCPGFNSEEEELALYNSQPTLPDSSRLPTLLTRCKTRWFTPQEKTPKTQRGFYPYQLFGRGTYFGDYEVFENIERLSCVRCEYKGSLLELHKGDLKRLLDDYPAFGDFWFSAAKQREKRRKRMLKKFYFGQKARDLAVINIQEAYRKTWKSTCGTRMISRASLGQKCEEFSFSTAPNETGHLWLPPKDEGEPSVASLRKDVDSLRHEMRTGFKQLQICLQAGSRGPLFGPLTRLPG